MATYTWIGDADGSGNGTWTTAGDWSPAAVPTTTDAVIFDLGSAAYTVYGSDMVASIAVTTDAVTFDGTIGQASSGPATFLTATNGAFVTLDRNAFYTGGAIAFDGTSQLDVQGLMITTGGTANLITVDGLNGSLVTSAQLTINQIYVQTGGSFAGDVALTDGGSITTDASSSFGGGTLTLLGGGSFYDAAAAGQTGGSGSLSDTVVLAAAGTGLNIGADPGLALAVSGPISGAGYLEISGGTVEFTGVNTYTGGTVVNNATLQVDQIGGAGTGPIFLTDSAFVDNVGTLTATGPALTLIGGGTSDTVTAGGSNLLVFGGSAGTFTFVGGLSSSVVVGGSGVLLATGGAGSDVIYGGSSGHDVLNTGTGRSTLVGGLGGGTLNDSNGGGNALVAYYGNTTLNASAATGNDTLFGAATGTTTFLGGSAGTTDTVVAGLGTSSVFGGTGTNDVFTSGGTLSLDYVIGFGGGTTNVLGFNTATDSIHLVGYSAAAALASAVVSGGNTELTLSDNTHIVLFGTTGVSAGNFT